ncbi:fibronectin type III domain-containing protein [candidate division KSB1 bacterium]|nr:fibronectin type III domain-containing protein [candidate division KSB1 bacterium]
MRIHLKLCLLLMLGSISFQCAVFQPRLAWEEKKVQQKYLDQALPKINRGIEQNTTAGFAGPIPRHTKVDSLHLNVLQNKFEIHLSKPFSFQPFRIPTVEKIYQLFAASIPRPLQQFKLQIYTLGQPIEELIPNYYRTDPAQYHTARLARPEPEARIPIVQRLSQQDMRPTNGLYHYNLVISHSHGWYYSQNFKRWEWQRPRMFSKVEDLLPFSFTIPYLIPMLERSGAVVFTTRERDIQTREVIVDNDPNPNLATTSYYQETPPEYWQPGIGSGYAVGPTIYTGHLNPFTQGTHRIGVTTTTVTALAEWIPEIPATGEYAVYITYVAAPENCNAVHYRIFHAGGQTDFLVNQQLGGKTWLYLGTFKFLQGLNPATGKVTVTNQAIAPGQFISVDAVRFGGGLGRIERGGEISGYPQYAEAARYHLQYFGMPDSLVYNLTHDSSDYKDDHQSRPEYANYLKGKPFGPNPNRDAPGLQIPIDLSLAFHTDAGIQTDSTIGTLMIYRVIDQMLSPNFPDSTSRWANRDLGDLIQTEIVQTIQTRYNPKWQRRALMDGDYSEARRANMPSCLLELLSHQNFTDMQYAVDPRFRFDIARAMYKGILKFLATQHQQNWVVSPLPVTHLRALFTKPGEVTLTWRPTPDPSEPTAPPDRYRIYTRVNHGGFDNGQLVSDTTVTFKKIQKGTLYSYQITAVNTGGESLPSEILAVCWQNEPRPPILIVNAFDRLAGPAIIDEPHLKGFAHFLDAGVGDQFDYGFTGVQFDFSPNSKYRTNDAPGHGASQAYFENQIASGNTRDYVYTHGQAIQAANYSFVSASDEALEAQLIDLKPYTTLDLIFGEEKPTPLPGTRATEPPARLDFVPWTAALKQILIPFLTRGGRLLASGAYVGRTLRETGSKEDSAFAAKWLKIDWQTGYASRTGLVYSVDSLFLPRGDQFTFNTVPQPEIYTVEAPDALNPQPGARTLMRYLDNRFSAVVGYQGKYAVLVCGFPLETILPSTDREKIMRAALRFLNPE